MHLNRTATTDKQQTTDNTMETSNPHHHSFANWNKPPSNPSQNNNLRGPNRWPNCAHINGGQHISVSHYPKIYTLNPNKTCKKIVKPDNKPKRLYQSAIPMRGEQTAALIAPILTAADTDQLPINPKHLFSILARPAKKNS